MSETSIKTGYSYSRKYDHRTYETTGQDRQGVINNVKRIQMEKDVLTCLYENPDASDGYIALYAGCTIGMVKNVRARFFSENSREAREKEIYQDSLKCAKSSWLPQAKYWTDPRTKKRYIDVTEFFTGCPS